MNNQPIRPQLQQLQQPQLQQQQQQLQQQQQQPQQAAGMNNLQLQTVLQAIFGLNGQHITNLTQQLQNQQPEPRELTLVKVELFHGKDDEDPHEWIELFNQAATANQWPDNRKVAIAAGYLRDAAHDWYVNDRANIQQ